ncbi:MAG TPA: Asp-tRNA(Asn)/Glu-tRNA(Gln) amidotransferase subunit GatC [Caldisericia bacterium]|nr:Asp-tRNA(Asn)/Glu-tRNA(Gln) amidotransferase subunit GatC [Caldisericia bacterium]HPF48172.1 Asp-tRNA(Asn)/Glu-tRNA(Gln) amidotransferase subunit GatC [Caldisericia bacterium]HPI83892.1 Asp-tRNA(Asn)/Glu-tRNA(Gln) amidotransferase subunit GatC [Caldisericia bacterium]HPQ92625.1 Asp-tRNA(Asn)/Glu-tRNA(Gln) amidotransferase subunit GatC [Caldisericia bacterium]HRV74277.1 Asp-tRNA(Asn)/Glu-tRNA(Gln) amidotransferase subunit GatC [Caldisericia bacterium]
MGIDDKDIKRVSNLARIDTDADSGIKADLIKVLTSFDALSQMDLKDVEPMVLPPQCRLETQSDTVKPSLKKSEILEEAPKKQDGYYLVPRIIGES